MVKVRRFHYVILGAAYMAMSGMLYAWTNYSAIINKDTGWSLTALALVFTVWNAGCALGNIGSGFLMRRFAARPIIFSAAIISSVGIVVSTFIGGSIVPFYIFFGVISGVGIGMLSSPMYTSVINWYPDKVGLISGVMTMGLGAGTLLLGAGASYLAMAVGWRVFFRLYALLVLVLMSLCAFIIRDPKPEELPAVDPVNEKGREEGFGKDYTSGQMLMRVSFWVFFFWATFGYMGNAIVSSNANQMAQQLNAGGALTNMSVGIHHVFCAIGSAVIGGIYDKLGGRKTLVVENILLLGGALCFVAAVLVDSMIPFVAGLIILGLATGGIPAVCSAHIRAYYGQKYYPSNFAIMGLRTMVGSVGSYAAAAICEATGGYLVAYLALSGILTVFFVLSSFIRKP